MPPLGGVIPLPAPAKLIAAASAAAAVGCSYIIWYPAAGPSMPPCDGADPEDGAAAADREHLRLRETPYRREDAARTAAASLPRVPPAAAGQLVTLSGRRRSPLRPEANGRGRRSRVALTAALRRREAPDGAVPPGAEGPDSVAMPCPGTCLSRRCWTRRRLAPAGAVLGADRRCPAPGPESAAGGLLPGGQPYWPVAGSWTVLRAYRPKRDQCTPAAGGLQAEYDAIVSGHGVGCPDPGQHRVLQTSASPRPWGAETARIFRPSPPDATTRCCWTGTPSSAPTRRGHHAQGPVPAEPGAGDRARPGGAAGHLPMVRVFWIRPRPWIPDDALANFDDLSGWPPP